MKEIGKIAGRAGTIEEIVDAYVPGPFRGLHSFGDCLRMRLHDVRGSLRIVMSSRGFGPDCTDFCHSHIKDYELRHSGFQCSSIVLPGE